MPACTSRSCSRRSTAPSCRTAPEIGDVDLVRDGPHGPGRACTADQRAVLGEHPRTMNGDTPHRAAARRIEVISSGTLTPRTLASRRPAQSWRMKPRRSISLFLGARWRGDRRGDSHVFTMEDGRALDPGYISREFQKIQTRGEPLPELTFHGLRHFAASLMLAGGGHQYRVEAARPLLDCDHGGCVRALDCCGRPAGRGRGRGADCSHTALTRGCEHLMWASVSGARGPPTGG